MTTRTFKMAAHNVDGADWRLNLACFCIPAVSFVVSAGDYLLPLAVFAIAAGVGLSGPPRKKVAALSTMAGFICALIEGVLLAGADLTVAPVSEWFSGR